MSTAPAIGKFSVANVGIFPYPCCMEELVEEIRAFAKARGWSEATVVRYATGQNKETWIRWEGGKSACSLDTAAAIRAFIAGRAAKYAPPSRIDHPQDTKEAQA